MTSSKWRVESIRDRYISVIVAVKETVFLFIYLFCLFVCDRSSIVMQATNQKKLFHSIFTRFSPGSHPLTKNLEYLSYGIDSISY